MFIQFYSVEHNRRPQRRRERGNAGESVTDNRASSVVVGKCQPHAEAVFSGKPQKGFRNRNLRDNSLVEIGVIAGSAQHLDHGLAAAQRLLQLSIFIVVDRLNPGKIQYDLIIARIARGHGHNRRILFVDIIVQPRHEKIDILTIMRGAQRDLRLRRTRQCGYGRPARQSGRKQGGPRRPNDHLPFHTRYL